MNVNAPCCIFAAEAFLFIRGLCEVRLALAKLVKGRTAFGRDKGLCSRPIRAARIALFDLEQLRDMLRIRLKNSTLVSVDILLGQQEFDELPFRYLEFFCCLSEVGQMVPLNQVVVELGFREHNLIFVR